MKESQKSIQQLNRQGHIRTHFHVHTMVFTMLFLLAGVCLTVQKMTTPFVDTILFVTQYGIFFGLILYWILSVRVRLLPSPSRRYTMIAGTQMLFFLLIQVVKYRVFTDHHPFLIRFCWYLYYIPFLMIPVMFTLSSIGAYESLGTKKRLQRRTFLVRLIYIVTSVLILLVLTNDFHQLTFILNPGEDLSSFTGAEGNYTYGPVYYAIIFWIVLGMGSGLALLINLSRRNGSLRDAMQILLFSLLWIIMNASLYFCDKAGLRYPYQFPHIHVFCMIGMFEACIRNRLLPCNEEDYPAFFAGMKVPAVITDYDLNAVYSTGEPMPEVMNSEAFRNSLENTVRFSDQNIAVDGRKLSNSLVFWSTDETTIHHLNDELERACEELSGENELMEAQNRLKERRARVEVRNKIYAGVSKRMHPAMKRLSVLLDRCEEDLSENREEEFRVHMSQALVITAYIKRASNLMLADPGEEIIPGQELYLALEESARYLSFCSVTIQISNFSVISLDREVAFSLYTAFEKWLEACFVLNSLPKRMSLACSDREIRVMAPESDPCPDLNEMEKGRAQILMERSEGLLFLTIRVPADETDTMQKEASAEKNDLSYKEEVTE